MVWCYWWPTDWSIHFPATSDRWHLRHLFVRWTASTLRECCSTNTTTDVLYYQHDGMPPYFSQVVRPYLNHKFPDRWTGRGCAQSWPPRSPYLNPLDTMRGVKWKLWCMHTRWTREKNYSSEFSALKCFVKLQVLWSHESEIASKQKEDTSSNLLQYWTVNL